MITVNVSAETRRILAAVQADEKKIAVALMRSLNRTIDGVKTDAKREIRKRYNVTAKALDGTDRRAGAFNIRYATLTRRVATLDASGNPLPLIGFRARQNRKGVAVSVIKGKRKTLRHAFIARMASGHSGVFSRFTDDGKRYAGKSGALARHRGPPDSHDLPIEEKYTVAVPGMLGAKQITAVLRGMTYARFEKAMQQNLRFALRG